MPTDNREGYEMTAQVMSRSKEINEKIAAIGAEASHIKEIVSGAIEGRVDDARRALKHGRHAAEEALDSATHQVKRHPLQSVGVTFGVGLAFGVIIGWLAGRKEPQPASGSAPYLSRSRPRSTARPNPENCLANRAHQLKALRRLAARREAGSTEANTRSTLSSTSSSLPPARSFDLSVLSW
jgi:ElaB/YqjD/DUF883 family membrane-anchored ribosome-binding protein